MGLYRWRIAGVRFLNGLLHGVRLRVGRERVGVSRRPFWILVEFPAPKSKPCVHFRKKSRVLSLALTVEEDSKKASAP